MGLTEGFGCQFQSMLVLVLWKDFLLKSVLDFLKNLTS